MSKQIAVQCSDLSKVYTGGVEALKKVSLNLEKGKIHIIIGPNGAGKTTFLRIATTELSPTSGSMTLFGHDVMKDKEVITRLIGVMPQQALMYKQLTAWEHIYFFTLLKGFSRTEATKETERFLKLLNLYDRRNDELYQFSGGMINAVNLAQAIAGDPEVLFLDEPTIGLDPKRRRIVWDYVLKMRGEKTVILTTQYLDEAHELADNVVVFNKGKVIHKGNIESILNKLSYELKLEIPRSEENLAIVNRIEKHFFAEQNDKIVLWVKDGKMAIQRLVEANIDLSSIAIQRATLEEAYLNMIED